MRRFSLRSHSVILTSAAACAALAFGLSAPVRAASNAVAASSNYVCPGQPVTLRWYFTGQKVTVSGGTFGKGKLVTGKSFIMDRPLKTTRYTFDVWYRPTPPKPAPAATPKTDTDSASPSGANSNGSGATSGGAGATGTANPAAAASGQSGLKTVAAPAKATPAPVLAGQTTAKPPTKLAATAKPGVKTAAPAATGGLLHAQYSTLVEVLDGMTPYQDPRGWQISYVKGWRYDKMNGANGSGVIWFQKEMDAVERVAVAVLPDSFAMPEQVMEKVKGDLGTSYNKVEIVTTKDLTYADMLAQMLIFTGNDEAHPGTKTESIVMTMVKNNRGYVISARTTTANFAARRAMLEHMVRSFAVMEAGKSLAVK